MTSNGVRSGSLRSILTSSARRRQRIRATAVRHAKRSFMHLMKLVSNPGDRVVDRDSFLVLRGCVGFDKPGTQLQLTRMALESTDDFDEAGCDPCGGRGQEEHQTTMALESPAEHQLQLTRVANPPRTSMRQVTISAGGGEDKRNIKQQWP